ncbi:MAG: hypothetical protein DRI48_07585 [Chloroflexi bacterium]|nr:MAG: hypothetical protein DRI48_07585 [Chloroflexota bacterium]
MEKKKMETKLIAVCGLDCTTCDVRRAPTDAQAAGRVVAWFREMGWLAEDEGMAQVVQRSMYCQGCRGDRQVHWSPDCPILRCCVDERGLTFCYQCDEFPCRRLDERAGQSERYAQALDRLQRMEQARDGFVQWLLDAPAPSIRYLTLRHLLECPETDAEVQAERREVHTSGPVPTILAGQTEAGNWAGEHSYYTPKYVSTHWSMLLLTELAADGGDPRLRRGAEFMLAATRAELGKALDEGKRGLSCFWGNLLRYVLHCGYAADPRMEAVVRYLVRDAGEGGWRCPYNDDLPCAWGAARALWALAALPARSGSSIGKADVEAAIQSGLTFLVEKHHLVEADYPISGRTHPLWFRLNFPLFYQTDVLFVLRVLAELDALDHPGARPALEWLVSRRQANGHWRGASPFRRRTWEGVADGREETDRWASLHAALVLRRARWPVPGL